MVRAPFDGIVSDRRVSAGDTAQVGKELVKVIDPASLRFEGFVSAESIGTVQRRTRKRRNSIVARRGPRAGRWASPTGDTA